MWDHQCPFRHLSTPRCVSLPLCPISAPPPCLDACGIFKSCLSDFNTVRFSNSSGCYLFWYLVVVPFYSCRRRRSMSVYGFILTAIGSVFLTYFFVMQAFVKLCHLKCLMALILYILHVVFLCVNLIYLAL